MKSAFCPVIRNNSPPARRQHIAKVCCFPIGTRLNSRQSRKPRPITRQPVFPTKPETRAPLRKPDRPLPEPETDHPAKQKARSSNRTGSHPFSEARPPLPGAGNPRSSSEARPPLTGAGNPRPSSEAVPCPYQSRKPVRPLPEPETDRPTKPKACPPLPEPEVRCSLFGSPSSSLWFPEKTGKPFAPPGQLFFLVRFADFSCARSRIPAILKPLFNPDRRRLYEKIWLNLCSRVRKRPKKSNLSKGLAHAS